MIELLLSALLQLALLSNPSTDPAALSAQTQTTLDATPTPTPTPVPDPQPDPNYGGGGTWEDDN